MSIDFVNLSKGTVSAALQERLSAGTKVLQDKVEGLPPEEFNKYVGVFVILLHEDQSSDRHVLIEKRDIRKFVADFENKTNRIYPIPESAVKRCEGDLPAGVLRVLYISSEGCGAMQVFGENAEDKARAVFSAASSVLDETKAQLVSDKLVEILKGLPKEDAREVLQDVQLSLDMREQLLESTRADVQETRDAIERSYLEKIPRFRERWASVLARSKKVVVPPDASTANNVETAFMAAAYVFDPITTNIGLSEHEVAYLIGRFTESGSAIHKLLKLMDVTLRGKVYSGVLQSLGVEWMRSGFPKLEVGQKLAASLALTDVPDDIEVIAPWKAWSLIVPPELLGPNSPNHGNFARIWCSGTSIKFVVMSNGELLGPFTKENLERMQQTWQKHHLEKIWTSLNSLVKGACLALSNPDDYKRQSLKERSDKAAKPQRDGEPDFAVSRFMLSAPVLVDLRQTLLDHVAGRKRTSLSGGSPTVQFFVRGHWRNQAHGPHRSLRKQIQIQGFWKGPEEGRVLLRNYKVKDEAKEARSENTEAEQKAGGGGTPT